MAVNKYGEEEREETKLQEGMAAREEQPAQTGQWKAQLDDTIDKILNREQFTYDMDSDAMYQQMKDQYIRQGQMAMMDTMGKASAMTGGYGNSYAQGAGQQAYQEYLQGLNDVTPQMYQMALDAYTREGDTLYNQYAVLSDRRGEELEAAELAANLMAGVGDYSLLAKLYGLTPEQVAKLSGDTGGDGGPKDPDWGTGITDPRAWAMVKRTLTQNLGSGNYDNVIRYMTQLTSEANLSEAQYNELIDMIEASGY